MMVIKQKKVERKVIVLGENYTMSNVKFHDSEGNTLKTLPQKGFISATADFRNNSKEDKDVTYVLALYNKKNEVMNVSSVTKKIEIWRNGNLYRWI